MQFKVYTYLGGGISGSFRIGRGIDVESYVDDDFEC